MEGSDDAGIAHDVAKLAALILADAEAVARTAQETIFRTVAEYQSGLVAPDDVYRLVLLHINAIWSSLSTSRPTETTMSSVNGGGTPAARHSSSGRSRLPQAEMVSPAWRASTSP